MGKNIDGDNSNILSITARTRTDASVISNLRLNPAHRLSESVSAYENQIHLMVDNTTDVGLFYRLNTTDEWTLLNSGGVYGLKAGTTYTIYVMGKNIDGDNSNILSITARTRTATPVISNLRLNPTFKLKDESNISGVSTKTNSIYLSATSSVYVNWYYRFNSTGEWKLLGSIATPIQNLAHGTTYSINIMGKNVDGDNSNELTILARTKFAAPAVTTLINSNKYNNQNGISASTDSISFAWGEAGKISKRYYRIDGGAWIESSSASGVIENRTAGTTYKVEVKSANLDEESNILSLNIRTIHNPPITTLTYDDKTLESLTFIWTSDKDLAYTYYKIDSGNWVEIPGTGKSGSFTIDELSPDTDYTITFYGTSTANYDSLNSNMITITADGTTHEIATVTVGECIFGSKIPVTISNPSGNDIILSIGISGNNRKLSYDFSVTKNTTSIIFTQEQLDSIYKCYATTNDIPLSFVMKTKGVSETYSAEPVNKNLILTGIAKTMYAGINNIPHRGQMWYGVNGVPRRAILWVGDENNKPRRCT
jgi:hypothetical protein